MARTKRWMEGVGLAALVVSSGSGQPGGRRRQNTNPRLFA